MVDLYEFKTSFLSVRLMVETDATIFLFREKGLRQWSSGFKGLCQSFIDHRLFFYGSSCAYRFLISVYLPVLIYSGMAYLIPTFCYLIS